MTELGKSRLPEALEGQRQRVVAYRKRAREEGFVRIDLWLEPEVEEKFQQLMSIRQMGRKELIRSLLEEAAKTEVKSDPEE